MHPAAAFDQVLDDTDVFKNPRVPLGVCENAPHARHLYPEENIRDVHRDVTKRQFHQDKRTSIPYRHQLPLVEFLSDSFAQLYLHRRHDFQGDLHVVKYGLQVVGRAANGIGGGLVGPLVVVNRRHRHRNALLDQQTRERHGLFHRARAVIKAGKQVDMNVDHGFHHLNYIILPLLGPIKYQQLVNENWKRRNQAPPGIIRHFARFGWEAKCVYDIVVRNALIIDGSGTEPFIGDVGICGDRVVAIGSCSDDARETLDVAGLALAPGFIDIHNHADHSAAGGLLKHPEAFNFIAQGVTTIIVGNCGGSILPVAEYLRKVQRKGTAVNFGTLVGHGTVRTACMGRAARAPTSAELTAMKEEVRHALSEGAFGLSTGLVYLPGAHAQTDEIIALATQAASAGGIYASHIRNEGRGLFDAIKEALTIGERAGLPVEISHVKCLGRSVWGKSTQVIDVIERAVHRGLDVTCDAYPYAACFSTLANLMTPQTLADVTKHHNGLPRSLRTRALGEIEETLEDLGGPGAALLAQCEWDSRLEGKRLDAIARKMALAPAEAALSIVVHSRSSSTIFFAMDQTDVSRLICHPRVMIATDAGVQTPGQGFCHPRSYGTFPRTIQTMVRDTKRLSLAEAVRKMTSAPADRLGIEDRGRIAEGAFADLVLFDADTISDEATYDMPHAVPQGIRWVMVNGKLAYHHERGVIAFAGRALRHAAIKVP